MVLLLVLMILACVLMVLALVMKVLTALALMLMIVAQSYLIFTDGFCGYLSNLSLISRSVGHNLDLRDACASKNMSQSSPFLSLCGKQLQKKKVVEEEKSLQTSSVAFFKNMSYSQPCTVQIECLVTHFQH